MRNELIKKIIESRPWLVRESTMHKPGEKYVKIGGTRYYFREEQNKIIPGHAYTRDYLHELKSAWRRKLYYFEWLDILKPGVIFFVVVTVLLIYGLIEREEHKVKRLEKFCSQATGFDATYYPTGLVKLTGKRITIDGKVEPVAGWLSPYDWLLFRRSAFCFRHTQDVGLIVEEFDYDGGDVLYNRSLVNLGWVRGSFIRRKVIWDTLQGTAAYRWGRIKGHKMVSEDKYFPLKVDFPDVEE